MTPEEAIERVRKAFGMVPRPEEFIRGTCRCEECLEHNATLAAHTPDTISNNELGNPGWDPMCFANDQAFVYYLPAMTRLAFQEEGYFTGQFLFHLNHGDRLSAINADQAASLLDALQTLIITKQRDIEIPMEKAEIDIAFENLSRISGASIK
jgi:hypothetical protein